MERSKEWNRMKNLIQRRKELKLPPMCTIMLKLSRKLK